jgi:hypothetical protein
MMPCRESGNVIRQRKQTRPDISDDDMLSIPGN